MIRVLHVLNNLGSGGAESFIMNIYRKIDREKIQFDFLIRSDKNGSYVQEIKRMGGRIYQIAEYPRHFLKNRKELKVFFKEHHEYKIIHVHANALIYIEPLIFAKKSGVNCRIIHSHSIKTAGRIPLLQQIHLWNKARIGNLATHFWACSDLAGKWMFGETAYEIINNGINLETFHFDEIKREQVRQNYQIERNTFVIGHVGRLSLPKNHKFLFEVFAKYQEQNPDTKLMLVGDGELKEQLQQLAIQFNISEKIIWVGAVNNVSDYLSAMDLFLFPSLYEGFPVSLIEAQAIGLPCIVSASITSGIVLNQNCHRIPLNEKVNTWVKAIYEAQRCEINVDALEQYDSSYVAKKLEALYLDSVR